MILTVTIIKKEINNMYRERLLLQWEQFSYMKELTRRLKGEKSNMADIEIVKTTNMAPPIVVSNARDQLRTRRIYGLDICRIVAVLFILMFHSNMHFKCKYGLLTDYLGTGVNFIGSCAFFMSLFFILSGFSLYHIYNQKNLVELTDIKKFYIKRFISIIPLYFTLYVLFLIIYPDKQTLTDNIILAPIEVLGLQSTFTTLFKFTHNDGTWFISCILICYIAYPYIQLVVKQMSKKSKIVFLMLIVFLSIYAPYIQTHFHVGSIYASCFYRLLEFSIGILLCSIMPKERGKHPILFSWYVVIIEFVVLFLGVVYAQQSGIPMKQYQMFNFVVIPLFMLIVVSMAGLECNIVEKSATLKKIIQYFSGLSYAFYLAQFFTWIFASHLLSLIGIDSNGVRILLGLLSTIVISVLMHEIAEKPIQHLLLKRYYQS